MAGEDLIVVGHDGGPVQIRLQGAGGIGQTGERVGEGHGQRILSEEKFRFQYMLPLTKDDGEGKMGGEKEVRYHAQKR